MNSAVACLGANLPALMRSAQRLRRMRDGVPIALGYFAVSFRWALRPKEPVLPPGGLSPAC